MMLEDIYRILRASHVQAQGVVDTIDKPLLVLDEHLCVTLANPAFFAAFHVNREDTVGESFYKLGNGQWNIPALTLLLRDVIPKAAAVVDYEVTHEFPSIGKKTMLVTARRLVHPDNNSLFMLVVFDDVTDRRREEAGRDLLAREIEHRLKNFLALVTALARQVPTEGEAAVKYRDAFLSRLEVLASAELGLFSHRDNDLATVVTSVLAPYGERIKVDRASLVKLGNGQVRTFSMILHELATNALKYGALSAPGGMVHLAWGPGKGGKGLVFDWHERGGPKASGDLHTGFGTRLIRSLVALDLGGTIDARFEQDGLSVRIEAPLNMHG